MDPSCPNKILARCRWSIHVGLGGTSFPYKMSLTLGCHFSWEFVTTLYFEWSIIRGHRYRWTIWVCNLASPLLGGWRAQLRILLLVALLPYACGSPYGRNCEPHSS